ncbi:MAG: NUDIX hydrolase [Acidimicrobiia bacterium]
MAEPYEELVEVIDESDHVVEVVPRWRMRAENLRHRAVYVLVTDSAGRLLIHRRSDAKDVWPGRWDLAAGGVVGVGESYGEAARRELAEELGIGDVPLEPFGACTYADAEVVLIGRVYRVRHDGPVRFADGEVVEARWVSRIELDERLRRDPFVPDSPAAALPLL